LKEKMKEANAAKKPKAAKPKAKKSKAEDAEDATMVAENDDIVESTAPEAPVVEAPAVEAPVVEAIEAVEEQIVADAQTSGEEQPE
jgi:ribonuclease E